MHRAPILRLSLAALALAACSTTRLPDAPKTIGPAPEPHFKVGAPYKIDGRWYVPEVDERYDEEGIASWYGDDFDGKRTANGEIFDKRRLSAAHKTLPMPTLAEVENLENGRRVVVRVNDRGPFKGDRVIDVSHAAADELGFAAEGLARVRVRYLGEADLTKLPALPGEAQATTASLAAAPGVMPAAIAASTTGPNDLDLDRLAALIERSTRSIAAEPTEIWVELAALENLHALETMNLDNSGIGPVSVRSDGAAQRLWAGPFIDEAAAAASLIQARAAGFLAARIVRGAAIRQ